MGRLRLRLVLVLLLLVAWLARWTTTRAAIVTGPERTGAVGAAALLVLWALLLTLLFARSDAGARRGAALVDAVLAGTFALLLALGHPWVAGGELRQVLAPVFVPLALLALLDAFAGGGDVFFARLRAGAALFAAVLMGVKGAAGPAGILAWLVVSPDVGWGRALSRRRVERLLLVASVVAFFAPELQRAALDLAASSGVHEGRFAWKILTAALALLTVRPAFARAALTRSGR